GADVLTASADAVDAVADDDGRAAGRAFHTGLPFHVRLADVALAGGVDRGAGSVAVVARVGEQQAAAEGRGRLRGRRPAPPKDGARGRFDATNAPGVVDQLDLVPDANQGGGGHRVSVAELLLPLDLAALLVEGAQAHAVNAGDDHAVFVKHGAAAHRIAVLV